MPTPFSASKFFNQQSSVTLQLRNDETGVCWGSTFSASLANDAAQFKAKAP